MKICIPCSSGGHLTELLLLAPSLKEHEIFFVTPYSPRLEKLKGKYKFYFVIESLISPSKFRVNFIKFFLQIFQTIKILLKERPDVILSTGASIAIPFFYFGKIMGAKTIFIETISRVTIPSSSGKFAYPISDMFFVQWKSLKKDFPKAVYAGRLA